MEGAEKVPVLVNVLFVPTLASGKAQVTTSDGVNDSLFTKPEYAAVPVTETVVFPSQFLLEADKPVMVRFLAETAFPLEAVKIVRVVAPVLLKFMD